MRLQAYARAVREVLQSSLHTCKYDMLWEIFWSSPLSLTSDTVANLLSEKRQLYKDFDCKLVKRPTQTLAR